MKTRCIAAVICGVVSTSAFAAELKMPVNSDTKPAEIKAPEPVKEQIVKIEAKKEKQATDAKQEPEVSLPKLPALPPVASETFGDAAASVMPLSPDQIRQLRKILDASQRATAEAPGIPPRPVATSISASLSPGATPPVIRLSQNFVSSVVFVDATGAAWPISSYAIGNSESFDVQTPNSQKDSGNVLTIIPMTAYGQGNISVFLTGESTPVTLSLVSGQRDVDYRADVRVQARGPRAAAPVSTGDATLKSNPEIMMVLDGLRPDKAIESNSSDPDVRVWMSSDGKMYVRTSAPLLSPAWIESRASADGMRAYSLIQTPVIVISKAGRPVQVKVDGIRWNPVVAKKDGGSK